MKILLTAASLAIFLITSPVASAGPSIPSLVGTWTVKSEGALMTHGKGMELGAFTHWVPNQARLQGEVEINAQEGRVIHGTFRSSKHKEPFIAVIGLDKRLYLADDDGFLEGRVVNKNTVEIVYRQVTAKDTVVAVGIWTRKK